MKRAIHPQAVAGHPHAVRWVTEVDLPVGRVLSAPGTVGPMLEYGVIEKILVERDGVWTWLAEQHSWSDHGPRIRDAIAAAVDLDGWQITEGSAELLELIARDVLEGELATYVASHGGQITVESATATSLNLDFGGACENCPAAGATLHDRIETTLQQRYPLLEDVHRIDGEKRSRGWLGFPLPWRKPAKA